MDPGRRGHGQALEGRAFLGAAGRRCRDLPRAPRRHRVVVKTSVPGGADFTTVGLFVWPVLFAAVTFGAMGSALTTAVIAAMSTSRLIEFARSSNEAGLWSESTQIVVLCVIALVVGRRVAAERVARLQADEARRAHLAAEARYRDLFETNGAPILIVDKVGAVVEANPAAKSVFATLAGTSTEKRLNELVDRQVARQLLEHPIHPVGSTAEPSRRRNVRWSGSRSTEPRCSSGRMPGG